jgi:acetyl esterase/lipase
MIHRLFAAFALLFILSAAGTPPDPAVAFGAREGIQQISLSPSGRRIAFIAPGPGQSTLLYTAESLSGEAPRRALTADGRPERLTSCGWVSETRLVCTLFMLLETVAGSMGEIIPATRIIAVDVDGRNAKMLSRPIKPDDLYVTLGGGSVIDWLPGDDGAVLLGRQYVPERKIGTLVEDKREGYGVDRIDTVSLAAKPVEPPKRQAIDYISDGHGNIRIMQTREVAGATGYDSGRVSFFYRSRDSRDWKPLGVYDRMSEEGLYPVAVDPALDVAYAYRKVDGRLVLHSVSLDDARRETLVFAHPQVDVDDTVRIGRGARVVGITYATERREAVYFDKPLEALARSLSKALPGLPLIRFVDASADESRLLLWAGSDTDPGRYYLFDKPGKQLHEVMLARPELEGVPLATMRPVTYKAADGTDVPAYLTLPAGGANRSLPAIVMPHGGPSARDEWGFDWLTQYFASRGYAVLQPNYRGSAGYGEAWYQRNGFQSWRTAIGDVNDAGRWLVREGIADPARLAIVGWSYGGYAALQSGVLDPDLYKAVVAIAPVTDLQMLTAQSRWWSDHRIARNFIGSGPHVREGSPAQNAARIKAPVLMFHGAMDRNVLVRQSRLMDERLRAANRRSELVVYPGLDHGLEDSSARAEMLRRADAFLREALGIR